MAHLIEANTGNYTTTWDVTLVERFAHLYPGTAMEVMGESEPRVLYRGARCILCGRPSEHPQNLILGSHTTCAAKATTPAP